MNPTPIILGIDPGINGGLALYAPTDPRHIAAFDVPTEDHGRSEAALLAKYGAENLWRGRP